MALIACIGWGSLTWDPQALPIQRHWLEDGPLLPVEFARQSSDGRMTLVICNTTVSVQTLWAVMECENMDIACEELRKREGVPISNISKHIGRWPAKPTYISKVISAIANWASQKFIDGVVWTDLPPKIDNKARIPSEKEVLDHLRGLTGSTRDKAEQYVRRAPKQIDTPYRRKIESELGWTPMVG